MTQSKRIEYVDIAKGLAIIAIVAGHLGFSGPDGIDWVSRFVFEFHVPVFFLISGYFLSEKQDIVSFARARAWRLLAPYAFTCAMLFAALLILKAINGAPQPPSIYPTIRSFVIASLYGAGSPGAKLPDGVMHIGAIWFLEALLISLVEVRVINRYDKAAPFIVGGLFAISIWSARFIWLPFNIQSGFIGGLYVYIGQFLKKARYLQREFSIRTFFLTGIVVVLGCLLGINVSIVRAYLGPWLIGLPVSLISCLWCLSLAQFIDGRAGRLASFLGFFGRNSLAILSVHLFLLDVGFKHLLLRLGVPMGGNALFFFNLLAQLAISAFFAIGAQRLPALRRIFYR